MATPKLRFKEFSGDWSNKKIGNIASKVGSGSTPRGGSEAYTDHGVIFIRSQNVNNDQLLLNDVAYIPEETHLKMSGSKVIANDILLNITGASIGRSCVVPHDFTEANVNQHVCIIRTPNDDPIFVQSFLNSENGQNAIQSKQAGGGREGLNFQAIRSIDFYFPPSKQEQTKIASFLSAVDEKIRELTQKHELLSQYKHGMMQKLFSQQIRFKADDGSEFGEWEYVFLGDISKPQQWKTISSSELTEIGYPVFGANGYIGFYHKYNHINETIVVTCRGATCGEVTLVKAKSYITGNAMSIDEINEKEHSTLYIYYALCFRGFKDVISGSAQPQIVGNAIRKVTFQVPCLEEQTKIANFLSAIDQKIEVVAQQIEQAKQWKKGLLQQMFV